MSHSQSVATESYASFDTTDARSELDALRLELHQFACQTQSRLAALVNETPSVTSSPASGPAQDLGGASLAEPSSLSDLGIDLSAVQDLRGVQGSDHASAAPSSSDANGVDSAADDPLNRLQEIKRRLAERLHDV